jgi:hypothetical protein
MLVVPGFGRALLSHAEAQNRQEETGIAVCLPARRAAQVEPMTALRAE